MKRRLSVQATYTFDMLAQAQVAVALGTSDIAPDRLIYPLLVKAEQSNKKTEVVILDNPMAKN